MDDKTTLTNETTQTTQHEGTESSAPEKKEAPKKDPVKLFPSRLSKFNNFYKGLVVLTAAGIGLAIYTAIEKELSWAALIAAITLLCYVRFCTSEMIDKLGLSYKTSVGSLTITSCRPKYGDILYIPAKLLWYDVEAIEDEAFKAKKNAELREVYFPRSLRSIGKDIFVSCKNLEAIRFEGSEDEWNAIAKETDFEGLALYFNQEYPTLSKKKQKNKSSARK